MKDEKVSGEYPPEDLKREDIRALNSYVDMINRFFKKIIPVLGIETCRNILTELNSDYEILKGFEITNNEVLTSPKTIETFKELDEYTSLAMVSGAFNEFISDLMEGYSSMSSPQLGIAALIAAARGALNERLEVIEKSEAELRKAKAELEEWSKTLEKKVEERTAELRREKTFSDDLFESSASGLVLVNSKKKIVRINEAARRMLGYSQEETVSKMYYELFCPSEEDKYPVFDMGERLDMSERVALHKDGREVPILKIVSKIEKEKEVYLLESFIDITERKQAEDKLKQTLADLEKVNKELDSFVYTASHDIRAPLRAISSFAAFLEEDYKDKLDEEGKDHLNEIRKGANRMNELIEDLLKLSRISRIHNPYEDVNINDLINSVKERIKSDIEDYKVKLTIQKNMPTVKCDRIKMAEVFLNLINNAIKFSSKNNKENPKVEIGYSDKSEYYQFYVKDNGIGIDPQYKEKIFSVFQRLHTDREYEGTGVGLSIVKRVIDDHGGHVWVESELGKGATFYFTMPKGLAIKKKLKKQP